MPWTINYIFVLIGAFLIAVVTTPIVRSLAFRVGAVDNPNARRINKKPMPSAGGLAILLYYQPWCSCPWSSIRKSGIFHILGTFYPLSWGELSSH